MQVYIIAEAGVNHNGNVETAKKMIHAAKKAGCDCIKFQTFSADKIVTKNAPKADYQIENTGAKQSQYEMLKSLELGETEFAVLKDCCRQEKIDFLSTPFDKDSAVLLRRLGVTVWKIPSGEITNKPLLEQIGTYRERVILSTGMAELEEVGQAVEWLREAGTNDIILLHCTSNYPTAPEDVNMRAMLTLKETFGLPIGYSDHTEGIEIPLMAVSMGAQIIEKHFTLDRSMPGPDHKASLEPDELRRMVGGIRKIEKAFGDGKKKPVQAEISTKKVARKSVVLSRDVPAGIPLQADDFAIKRPGTGIAPADLDQLIGRKLKVAKAEGTLLSYDDFTDERNG